MEDRIRFIDHQGKQILLVDFSNCPAKEVEKIARGVPDYVIVQPRGSVLVLTDFSGAAFDQDSLRAMKETAVFDKPFVKKSALIGTENFPCDLRGTEKLLPAGTADFQNPRGSLGLAGGRLGGRGGQPGLKALTAKERKVIATKGLQGGGQGQDAEGKRR